MGWKGVCIAVIPVLLLGCKKPQVEVEEDGPPLPLPPSQGAAGQPGRPGQPTTTTPGQNPAADPQGRDQPTLSVDDACRLIDAHMKFHGVNIADRECSNLRQSADTMRLNRYDVKGKAGRTQSYNFCLWPDEGAGSGTEGGWQVGYVDQAMQPCRDRDLYCKAGAPNRVRNLSWRGCPGDREHAILNKDALREQLVGRWRRAGDDERPDINLVITADATFAWRGDGRNLSGRFELLDTTRMEVTKADGSGFSVGFALVDGALFLKPFGIVAPGSDEESFLAILGPNSAVRRFRGACYEIKEPAREAPSPVDCKITKNPKETFIDIQVDESRQLTLIRTGKYWLDGDVVNNRFIRMSKPEK